MGPDDGVTGPKGGHSLNVNNNAEHHLRIIGFQVS